MSVSRLLATTNVGHEKVIVSLIIDDVMPVECVRRVHRVATFSHTQPVQDTANHARAAPRDFRGVAMPKGQIFITQDTHSGPADLQETILPVAPSRAELLALIKRQSLSQPPY